MTHSGLLALFFLAFASPLLLPDVVSPAAIEPADRPTADQVLPSLLDCTEETLEFIPDGDFGSGPEPNVTVDPGLSPNLEFGTTAPIVPGFYAIVNDTEGWGTQTDNWITIDDNSDPNGYMMIVSASNQRDTLWQRTFNLCPGATFEFAMDAINLANIQPPVPEPSLELLINGEPLHDFGRISQDESWDTYTYEFITNLDNTEFTLALVNNTIGTAGNDLALDNLTLTTCAPGIEAVVNTPAVCPGDPVSLAAAIGSGFDAPFYQWQVSLNDGPFRNVGNPSQDKILEVDAVPPAARYRVLAAPEPELLEPGACAVISEPVAVSYTPIDQCVGDIPIGNITDQLCGGKLGANLIEDGGFGTGQDTLGPPLDDGITTLQHNSVDSFPQRPGQYVIAGVLNADPCEGFFDAPCWTSFERDSTDSTGYRMVIDADATPDIFFQAEVDSLCENTTYQFSVEVLNLAAEFFAPNNPDADSTVALPSLDLVVAPVGTPLEILQAMEPAYSSGTITNDTSLTTVGFTFEMAPGESEILVAVRNAGEGGFGNDLAIDNVRVSVCGPQSRATYEMTCPDPPPPLTLTAEILGNEMGPEPAIQWIRLNQGGDPEVLDGEIGETLDLVVYNAGDTYAFYVAENEANLLNPNCRIESDPAVIDFFPEPVEIVQRAICTGESITFNGNTYDEAGTYPQPPIEGGSVNGCDSVVILELQVADPIQISLSETLCIGESVEFAGDLVSEPGIYVDTLQAQGGCDSIVTLALSLENDIRLTEEICEGDSVEMNGVFYSETGIYRDTLIEDFLDCGTLFVLDLTVLEAPRREETVTICPGDSYQGVIYFADTTLQDTIPNDPGCDSIIVTNIDTGPLGGFAIQGSTILCGNGLPVELDATAENATYLWSTGETTPTLSVSTPGSYAVEVTSDLCTVRDTVEVTEGDMELGLTTAGPFCASDATGSIEVVQVNGGQAPYTYILDGNSQAEPLFTNLTAGDYELTVEGNAGCTVTQTVTIFAQSELQITLTEQINLIPGDTVQLDPLVEGTPIGGSWSPSTGLSCTDCLNPIASPANSTTYTLTLFDANGCEASAQVFVNVEDRLPVFAPNAFSPNGDGINDFFTLFTTERVIQVDQLLIFDRWGNQVFERSPLLPNDEALGWDGTVNGQDSPVGVYVYFAELTFSDNSRESIQGDVVLLR